MTRQLVRHEGIGLIDSMMMAMDGVAASSDFVILSLVAVLEYSMLFSGLSTPLTTANKTHSVS